jgi:LDH2 family malate/lactate/ureidoglycolate dehydrogenase
MKNRLAVDRARTFAERVLICAGLSKAEASAAAESLILAELRGLRTHGLSRLRTYAARVRSGVITTNVVPRILNESPSALLIDGKNGIGMSIGLQVMDICIERARKYGCCFASVNRGNHFGIAGFFTMHAVKEDMIGIAMSNAPASVVPTGGSCPMLGTNPLSIAVPAGKHPALVLDMATSVVAQGKVITAVNEGRSSIPETWAVDVHGNPTTNPEAALKGAMLPFGGPKGYGISFIVEILCSVLSGALTGTRIHSYWNDFKNPQGLGYFIGAFDVEAFVPLPLFKQRMDELIEEMKSCPTAPGIEHVYIPGELEYRRSQQTGKGGIEIDEAVYGDLQSLGIEYGADFP